MASIRDEVASSEKKIKEIQDFAKKTDEYKVRVEEVAKNIESVQKQLPVETNDPQILGYLQSETSTINIKDAEFSPGKEEKSTYYISKEYKLKGRGTFLQFLIFFERIGNADRIYNIKELKLTTPSEFQKGRFQIISGEGIIQAFRLNPEFKVDRGF
jgi:Tfp pilus assembly protein PilO